MDAVRVGLVGAGPWATGFTAPLLAAGPACTLSAVWARRPELATALAARHGAIAVGSFDELLAASDAVAFAVPPDVQADLAATAARAGLPVLLDKPIGLELAQAERLADAITASGVVSQLILTNRYLPAMRRFLEGAADLEATAGRATFLGDGAVPGHAFATSWRLAHGGLLDLGPHVLDALDVALGPIVGVDAVGDPFGVVALTCRHEGGAISQATLSATTPVEPSGLVVELFGPHGRRVLDTTTDDPEIERRDRVATMDAVAGEFAAAVRTGISHELDVHRGLHLQRLIDTAASRLAAAR
ncbi:MAG: Gfo/Idh/MocA family oxidoreductase [Ilumatobacteraceae bacterium]